MKNLLILFALLPFVLQGQIPEKGLIFHAPLSEWHTQPGAQLTSGTLTTGKVYTIGLFVAGDDFTNVGGTNTSGTTFVATGTTPTTWTNGSILRQQNYYTTDLISGIKGTNTDVYNGLGSGGDGRRSLVYAGAGSSTIADADRYDVGTGDFSISMKIKPANITDNGKYLINKEASEVGYGIYQEDNDLWIRFDDGTTDVSAIIGTDVLAVNTELEFSIVFSRAGNASLYTNRNSTPVGTVAISTAALTLSNAGSIVVGNASAGSAGFSGEISLCRLFNFALTATQAVNYMKPEYSIEINHQPNTGFPYQSDFSGGVDGWSLYVEGSTGLVASTTASDNILHYAVTTRGSAFTRPTFRNTGINLISTRTYLITIDYSVISGTPILYALAGGGATIVLNKNFSGSGTYTYTLTVGGSDTQCNTYWDGRQTWSIDISSIKIEQQRCVLDLNAEGVGYATNIWQDRLNSLSATVSGATVSIPPSSELGAVKCNGSSSVVTYSSMPGLTGNISLSGWINPLYIAGAGRVFSNGKVILYTNASGYLSFTRDGSTYINSGAGSIAINNWYHVVWTSSSTGASTCYINGVLSGTAGQAAGTPAAGTTYYLGRAATAANYFNGSLDDFRFYNRILSQEEITLLYQSGH